MRNRGFHFTIQSTTAVLFLVVAFALHLDAQVESPLPAQTLHATTEITGKIIDKDTKEPLEFSTISLFSKKDSSLLTGTTSLADGTFALQTTHSDFFLKIEFLAYLPAFFGQAPTTTRQLQLDLGLIELMPDIARMKEVEVLAEKSSVTMSLDKRVFNVGKDLTSVGGTAEDVLRNVPGITVDNDGRFSLRGSGNIRILLNGRASSLVSNENLTGLRQLRASQIERVEIITNPSARYEAEGMAGIVNIVLKTSQKKGLNSSVDALVGNNQNMGAGVNLNLNKGRFNGFFGLGGWYLNRPGTGSFRNRFYKANLPDSTVFSSMNRTHERSTVPSFIKFGADYFLNLQNVITTSFAYRSGKGRNSSNLVYKDALGYPENIYQITQRQEDEKEGELDLLYSLIYRRSFTRKGHQLIAEIQYENKSAEKTSVFEEQYFDGAYTPLSGVDYLQLSSNKEGNRRIGGNADYTLPFAKEGKFETGWQSTIRSIGNNYEVREVVNSIENPDADFTNDFLYQEAIHAAYMNLGNSIKKISLQAGLRLEHSDVTTKLLTTNHANPRKYTNLFPSAFLAYKLTETDGFQLSYSRRIQRPVYSDLNPFFTIRDRRNIFRGNPNIDPEYTNAFELGYIRYWEKASLSTVAYYRLTHNVIKRLQRVDSNYPGVTITQAENLDFKRNYGVEFTYSYFPNPKWRLNGDVNLYHSHSKGSFWHEGKELFVGGGSFSMETKASSRHTIKELFHTQMTLGYAAPRTTTQGINRSITSFDIAIGFDFLKKNGTLALSVNDLFNSRRRRSYSEDETFYSEDNFLWHSRSILLSFNYRIKQQKEPNRVYVNPFIGEEVEEY